MVSIVCLEPEVTRPPLEGDNDVLLSSLTGKKDENITRNDLETPEFDSGLLGFLQKFCMVIRDALYDSGIVQISILIVGIILFIIALGF